MSNPTTAQESIRKALAPILSTPAGHDFLDGLKQARDEVNREFGNFENVDKHPTMAFFSGQIFTLNTLIDALEDEKNS